MNIQERLLELETTEKRAAESDAAARVYQRLLTAQVICGEIFGESVEPAVVVAVLEQLSTEAWEIMDKDERLYSDAQALIEDFSQT